MHCQPKATTPTPLVLDACTSISLRASVRCQGPFEYCAALPESGVWRKCGLEDILNQEQPEDICQKKNFAADLKLFAYGGTLSIHTLCSIHGFQLKESARECILAPKVQMTASNY